MVPLPSVGGEAMKHVALKATPGFGPFGVPMSSVPVILRVAVTPSGENSPEKTTTPNAAGLVV
jgi:hypothetical protein